MPEKQGLAQAGLRPVVSLRLWGSQKAFGPGMRELLQRVDNCHSLRMATQQMGLAYSKAWKMLRECEKQLGFALIHRQTGGERGGGSSLTPEGRRLLERYLRLEQAATQAVQQAFDEIFTVEQATGQGR